jgi:hypothetical protein
MKNVVILLTVVFLSINVTAQHEKVLVKTIAQQKISEIAVNMDGELEVKTWNKGEVRILIHIEYLNAKTNLMKVLIAKGRYNIDYSTTNDTLTLSCEALKQPIVFGKDEKILEEKISYTLMVPEGVSVEQVMGQLAANK